MKILMVDSLIGNDYTIHLCTALKSSGIDVSLVLPENRSIEGDISYPLIPLMPSKGEGGNKYIKSLKYISYLIKLFIHIKKYKINIIHFQFFRRPRMESIYFKFLTLMKLNLVYTVHDVMPLHESKIDHLFNLLVYKSSKILLVHSENNRTYLINQTKVNPAKIKVVPHGNFDTFLSGDMIDKLTARAELKIEEKKNVLLFFGFIKKYKGLDILIEALKKASDKATDFVLIIAGAAENNELEQSYMAMIDTLPANVEVVYHPYFIPHDKVSIYFLASDLVVLPYRTISHSGVLHLAYSFGKPVIATDVGDFKESIEEGKSGFILLHNDPDHLADKLVEAFSNLDRLENMGIYARNLSETKYSWDNISLTLKNIYTNLLLDEESIQ